MVTKTKVGVIVNKPLKGHPALFALLKKLEKEKK